MTSIRRRIPLVALCMLLVAPLAAEAGTVNLYRTANVSELGIANYQGVENLRLHDGTYIDNHTWINQDLFVGDAGNDADNRALIGFDLSALGGLRVTGDATLRLRVTNVAGTVDGDDYFDLHTLYPTNTGWAEGQSTWNRFDQPNTIAWKDASGTDLPLGPSPDGGLGAPGAGYEADPLATLNQTGYAVGDYVTLTIPQAEVQAMIDGNNPGMVLRHRDEDKAGRLAFAKRNANANGPNLTIEAEKAPYMQAVQADAPLVYYRLNETAGTTAFSVGTAAGKNGTYMGAAALTQPGPGPAAGFQGFFPGQTALGLDGTSSYVQVPATGISGNQARTYEGWFNATTGTQAFYGTTTTTTGRSTRITVQNDEIAFAVNGHNYGVRLTGGVQQVGADQIYTPAALGDGWHHVAISLAGGAGTTSDEFRFFIDGVDYTPYAKTLGGSPRNVNTLNAAGTIGRNHDGTSFLGGAIDEFAVYGTDIGRAGAAAHYAAAVSGDLRILENDFAPSRLVSVAQGNRGDWPDGSTGTDRASVLQVRERSASESGSALRTVSFLEFDLAGLAGQEVLNAILTFRMDSRNVNPQYLQLARVTDDWTEADVAFAQAVADAFRFGGTNTTGTGVDKGYTVDVTDIVADWVRGAEDNHGFRLAFDAQGFNIATFYADGEFAPQLTVTTAAVPEPATLGLLGLAAAGLAGYVRRRRTT